ncbi:MAG TPA: hypothetical protein VIM94_03135 [Salegentibacter sp.]|uniref:hypothetical protein n=1 Tax=Salegentibacter sp. TaxID=1903072 RepID=UPI002F952BCC
MRFPILLFCCIFLLAIINIYGVVFGIPDLVLGSGLLFFLPLLAFYYKKLNASNLNLVAFCCFALVGIFAYSLEESWYYKITGLICFMSAYIFLGREALHYTKREQASKYMLGYFLLVVMVNSYLLLEHLLQLELYINSQAEYLLYVFYYLNLLLLGGVALVFYLNSYSRKSVYFITLVLAFIFADVFRDMGEFYLQDTVVVVLGNLLRLAAILFAFLFFVTPEKKLRLLHMI